MKHLLAKDTKFKTPYYVIKGRFKGKTVMITAGVHGNERANVLAANKVVDLLQKDILRIDTGTLIIVPIVNQIAYSQHIRGIPDLNRTFPRNPVDLARHPLSAALFQLAEKLRPDWYIDLHEANGLSNINPRVLGQSLITNPKSEALPCVRRMIGRMNRSIIPLSKHFTVRRRSLPGSGRNAAFHLLNAKAITVETCWSLPVQERVRYQKEMIHMIMTEAGLIKDAAVPNKSKRSIV